MRPPRRPWRIDGTAGQMLLIACPHCGTCPELEFAYAGEANIVRPAHPNTLDDDAWSRFLYQRSNPRGLHAERWRHTHGCGRFFNAWRDTVSDRFCGVWSVGATAPEPAP